MNKILQQNLADDEDAKLISLDYGHYIHQHDPEYIARKCKEFLVKKIFQKKESLHH
ncbi:hypothetical protein FACS189418_1900 [Clostridia bacterium]|nr:hypothetical protein FACS189418_1900 [Clostridia bacterium]